MGRARRVAGGARVAVIALLPAVLVLCFAVAWSIARRVPRLPRPFGEPSDAAGHLAPAEVAGFEGSLALEGGRLTARLMPLQALPEWQAFDAAVLQRRLSLAPGEPWRVALTYEATHQGALALDLEALRVLDAAGGAPLAPLALAPEPVPGEPADPLRVLFGAHPGALEGGVPAEIVLWGGAPGDAPRVAIGGLEIALAPVRVKAQDVPRSIARLEPPGPEPEEAR